MTDDHGQHGEIHRVTYPPIWSGDHEFFRWCYRGWGSQALPRKPDEGIHEHCCASDHDQYADDRKEAGAGQTGPNSHPVSSHGTTPATTQGAAMKKTALPMAAAVLGFKRYFRFRRAFADSLLFAFCNALTSSSLLIFERPTISNLVACS